MVTCSLLLILFVFICEINVNNLKLPTEFDHNHLKFKFEIIDNVEVNVALEQRIISNMEEEFCVIGSQKFTVHFEVEDAFNDVKTCRDKYNTPIVCAVPCSSLDVLIRVDALVPKALYWSLRIGTSKENVRNSESGKEVYGLETPPIYKDLFAYTLGLQSLDVKTYLCENIECVLKYNDVEYRRLSHVPYISCSFYMDLDDANCMIPGYILECSNYPKILLNTTNQLFYNNIGAYKPQYNVYYDDVSGGANNLYHIHFNTLHSDEICHFSYKVANENRPKNSWKSNCDEKGSEKECYAPCKDVKLFDESTYSVIIQVMIKTRPHLSDLNWHLRNSIVWERDSPTDLIIYQKKNYFIMDGNMVKRLSSHITIIEWELIYYEHAYSMTRFVIDTLTLRCDANEYDYGCDLKTFELSIRGLPKGAPLILGIYVYDGQYGFMDSVYVVTPNDSHKKCSRKKPQARGSNILIKAVEDDITEDSNDKAICIYFVSPESKNWFREAKCDNNYVCRGFCDAAQTIVGLVAGESYDIRVLASTAYGFITYKSIKMGIHPMPTVDLKFNYELKGTDFKVTVKSLPFSNYTCNYVLFIYDDETEVFRLKNSFGDSAVLSNCDEIIVKNIKSITHYLLVIIFPKDTNNFKSREVIEITYIDYDNLDFEYENNGNEIKVTIKNLPRPHLKCKCKLSSPEDDSGTLKVMEITSHNSDALQDCEEIVAPIVEDTKSYLVAIISIVGDPDYNTVTIPIGKALSIIIPPKRKGGF